MPATQEVDYRTHVIMLPRGRVVRMLGRFSKLHGEAATRPHREFLAGILADLDTALAQPGDDVPLSGTIGRLRYIGVYGVDGVRSEEAFDVGFQIGQQTHGGD
jgi:hypothetical protein